MPRVHFIHPYGDFPQYKQGDIVTNPSPELLAMAQQSNCLEILPDEDVGAQHAAPADEPEPHP